MLMMVLGLWSLILIISISVTGFAIKHLAILNISYSESLIIRGLSCLAFVLLWSIIKKHSLLPKAIKIQMYRLFIAGVALVFITVSYYWLSASAVSVISNIDVPLMIVFGQMIGVRSSKNEKIISLISMLFLIWYCVRLDQFQSSLLGLFFLVMGLSLLCFGYALIKKSMTEENSSIVVLTPAVAILFFGLCSLPFESDKNILWNNQVVVAGILSGFGMFVAYHATMQLYKLTDIASAEFPTLLSSLIMQPLESWVYKSTFSTESFLISSVFVCIVFFIIRFRKE